MNRTYIPNSELLEALRDARREVELRRIIEKTCSEIEAIFSRDTKEQSGD